MDWNDSLDIAIALEETYPNADIINLRYSDFHAWIMKIPGFKGDPGASNEKILETIHRHWLEERGLL